VAFANAVDCSKFVAYHETGDDRRSAICSIVCSRFGRLMLRAPTRKARSAARARFRIADGYATPSMSTRWQPAPATNRNP
jgi:hypothetical protein